MNFTYIFRMFRFYTELELATVEDSRELAGLLYQELLNRWAHVARLTGGHGNLKNFYKCFFLQYILQQISS
jgi:hypothetical protein